MRYVGIALCGVLFATTACQAPTPAAVSIEPVFVGKYGAALPGAGVCVPDRQSAGRAGAAQLPLCADYCADQGNGYAGLSAQGVPICTPTARRSEDQPGSDRSNDGNSTRG